MAGDLALHEVAYIERTLFMIAWIRHLELRHPLRTLRSKGDAYQALKFVAGTNSPETRPNHGDREWPVLVLQRSIPQFNAMRTGRAVAERA